jgi:hypothetical protein
VAEAKIVLSAFDHTKIAIESAKRNLSSLSDSAGAIAGRFGTLGLAITGAFSAVTLKGAIDTLDKLDDLSEKTGIATESLSALRYAGEVTGTPIEALATGITKLSKNMAEAAGGNKEAVATFKALGIEIKNNDGSLKSQDQILLAMADRFSSYRDGAEKSALAQRAFGKTGAEMIPLLNQGAAGIQRLRSEAEALGAIYGGQLAKDAAAFNDNLKKLELNAEAAKVNLVGGLLPTLNRLLETYIGLSAQGSVWTAMEQGIASVAKYLPIVSALAGALSLIRGGHDLTGDHAGDINRLLREREALDSRQKNLESRGEPTDGLAREHLAIEKAKLEKERKRIEDLLKVARVYQAQEAQYTGDTSDAMSRRLAIGRQTAAPVVTDGGKAAKEAEREMQERARILAELSGVQADYNEQLARLQRIRKDSNLSEEQYVQLVTNLIEKQPMAKKLIEDAARAEKDLADTKAKTSDMQDRYLAGLASEADAVMKRNADLADEIDELGLTADALDILRQMRLASNIERERENLLIEKSKENNELGVAHLERKIALMERQLGLEQQMGTRRITVESAETARAQSTAMSDGVRDDLRGAINEAFRTSENPAEAFAMALGNAVRDRLTSSIADSLTEALLGKQGTAGIGGMLGGLYSGGLGGLQGAFSQTSWGGGGFGSGYSYGNFDLGTFLHSGGIAGNDSTFHRSVHPSVWKGAKRYHVGGLAGNEVPAILERGEGVFTKSQMKALGAGAAGGGVRDLKVSVINNGEPVQVTGQQRISEDEIALVLDRVDKKLQRDMSQPNSRFSENLGKFTNAGRRRY